MVHRGFGLNTLEHSTEIERLLASTNTVDSDTARVLINMTFDIANGLYYHNDPSSMNPLASVMMHDKERYQQRSGLYRIIERFNSYDIAERFGLSLTEFLALPHDVIENIFEITVSVIERQQKKEENAEQQAQQEMERDPKKLWRNAPPRG